MIRRSGERGSGISLLAVRHDDDDDLSQKLSAPIDIYTYKSSVPITGCRPGRPPKSDGRL